MYRILMTVFALCFSTSIFSQVLIVNGLTTTSEVGTTTDITANLETLHAEAGNTTVTVDTLPADISGYNEIWDIRFSNSNALSATDIASYLTFLQRGGSLFLMGENIGFMTRNNTIFDLVDQAGGGTLTFTNPLSTQTVLSPFDQPNAVTSFTYNNPGGVTTPGTGAWATQAATGGTAIHFERGTLSDANAGTLTIVFDVNFMEGDATSTDPNIQFFKNLINVVTTAANSGSPAVTAPIPSTSIYALIALLSLFVMCANIVLKQRKK